MGRGIGSEAPEPYIIAASIHYHGSNKRRSIVSAGLLHRGLSPVIPIQLMACIKEIAVGIRTVCRPHALFWANNLPKMRGAAMRFSAAEEDKHTRRRSEASGKTPAHGLRFAKRSIVPALHVFCVGFHACIFCPPEIVWSS